MRVAPVGVAAATTARASSRAEAPAARRNANVEVYSYDAKTGVDTLGQKTGSAASNDAVVRVAFENAAKVVAYYRDRYGRDSFDNRGTTVKVRVHAPDANTGQVPANNAYWFNDEKRMWFGDGDGSVFAPLGNALDVVAHEFTHGVIDSEIKLETDGQEGGLHESFSDVMATGIDGNWTIAEDVWTPGVAGDALRDFTNPKYKHMTEVPPWAESHDLASIPNAAAYKVAQTIGGDQMRKIWYKALTDKLASHAGFSGAAQATLSAAELMHGKTSREYAAVRDAWAAVGVDDATPKERIKGEVERFTMANVPHVKLF